MTSLKVRLDVYGKLLHVNEPLAILCTTSPALITLWLATGGRPSISLVFSVFIISILSTMGSMALGDWGNARKGEESADYPIPPQIEKGDVATWEALLLGLVVYTIATVLVWLSGNIVALAVELGALVLIAVYIFMRNVLRLPYLLMSWCLGLLYSTGIPLAYALVFDRLAWYVWAYVGVNMFFTAACDLQETIRAYALPDDTQSEVEKELRPESMDVPIMVIFYGIFFVGCCALCYFFQLGPVAWGALVLAVLYLLVWSLRAPPRYSLPGRRTSSGFSGQQFIVVLLFVGVALDYVIRLGAFPELP